MKSITNFSGQTFTVGRRVRHTDGWTGTITAIRETPMVDLLLVEPDEGAALGRNDAERPLNSQAAAEHGRPTYCRPRDTGLSMGNYTPIA
jgi:hypothetical protein